MAPLAQGHQTAKKGTQMQPMRHQRTSRKALEASLKGTGRMKKGTNKRSEI